MSSVYERPEDHGLRIVGVAEREDLAYEFDMFVVWQDTATGEVYYARDEGCSCPVPFEWATSREKLCHVRTFDELSAALDAWNADSFSGRPKADVSDVRRRVWDLFAGRAT